MSRGKKVKNLNTKYSSFTNNRSDIPEQEPKLKNSMKEIYPSLREFKKRQEDTDPVLRNMDANLLQRLNDD